MTVGELIAKLQKLDQNAPVLTIQDAGGWSVVDRLGEAVPAFTEPNSNSIYYPARPGDEPPAGFTPCVVLS